MISTLKFLRILSDPTRLRLISLLEREELAVGELREITQMGQSRVSTHLGMMHENGILTSRREGRQMFYRLNRRLPKKVDGLIRIALCGTKEIPESKPDQINLKRIVARRKDQARLHFDQVAGRFDRSYGPGRSWQAFGHLLLQLLPALEIADLGSGEGLLSELLAHRAKRVIAIDNSPKMVAFGQRKAKRNGLTNLEFRLGDLAHPPIEKGTMDLVIFSQALHHSELPDRAIQSSFHILRRLGRVAILDLLRHDFEEARALYGDCWLGFDEAQLEDWLSAAGFLKIDIRRVAKEFDPPHFQTLLASAIKP